MLEVASLSTRNVRFVLSEVHDWLNFCQIFPVMITKGHELRSSLTLLNTLNPPPCLVCPRLVYVHAYVRRSASVLTPIIQGCLHP